jgi:hypothetical protein
MTEIRVGYTASVSSGVTRYRIYYGPVGGAAGLYNAPGSPKEILLANPGGFDITETGTRHIAMTAINDSTGLESGFSTELVGVTVLGLATGRTN